MKRTVRDIENTLMFSIPVKLSGRKKVETIFTKFKAENLSEIVKKITQFKNIIFSSQQKQFTNKLTLKRISKGRALLKI